MKRIFTWIGIVAAIAAFYAWFVDEAIVSEAIAAACVGIASWAAFERLRVVEPVQARVSLAVVRPFVVRVLPAAVRESYDILIPVLFRAFVRRERIAGRWISLRYDGSDTDGALEHGRRTAVVFASNLTPNALPLDISAARGRLVLHQLVHRREAAADDARYPI